jgi:hypothetical protein
MIKIRELENKDLTPLSEFLPKGFPTTTKEFWLPVFEWWWTLNPAYTDQFPRGWILEKNGSIVGFIGNIPVKFLVNGVVRIAAASNSWYVDPSVRGIFSFALFNEFLKQKGAALFLFKGEDTKNIMNILSKYQFEEYILPKSQKEYVYIIDKKRVHDIFTTFLVNNRMPQLSHLWEYSKRLGFLFFTYLYQKPPIGDDGPYKEIYISSVAASCDDTFCRLWEPLLNACDVTLLPDAKTLNWLYFSSARSYTRIVIQCHRSRDNILVGYMVFDLTTNKKLQTGSMQLLDMCIENNDPHVLASLITFAIKLGKQKNAALLIVWAKSPETEIFFGSTIILSRTVQQYRYIRFSGIPEITFDRDTYGNVCLPMMYPPQ